MALNERIDLSIKQGTSKTYRITVTDKDTGDPVDLTGATAYFTVQTKAQLGTGLYSIDKVSTTPTDITILTQSGTTLGQFEVFLVPSDTSALTANAEHFYDSWVELATGKRYPVLCPAKFTIEQVVRTTFP